jgi:hypothetical protein
MKLGMCGSLDVSYEGRKHFKIIQKIGCRWEGMDKMWARMSKGCMDARVQMALRAYEL